jgi:hypothetical protein
MKNEDKRYVKTKIATEGFYYTFVHYSQFDEIEDEEFHRLRKAFLEASENLKKYLFY